MPGNDTPHQTERERFKNAINRIWLDTKPGHFDEDIIDFIIADRKEYARALLGRVERNVRAQLDHDGAARSISAAKVFVAIEAERRKI